MKVKNAVGVGVYIAEKVDQIITAYEFYEATQSQDAVIEIATLTSELVAGIAISYLTDRLVTAVQASPGLERVFASLGRDKFPDSAATRHSEFLKDQLIIKNTINFSAGKASDIGIGLLREWVREKRLLDPLFDLLTGQAFIDLLVNLNFINARNWFQRRDPLVLDLDGDGIETKAPSTTDPILFDLTASGVKISVGWVKPDDGFLVLDRNGNGTIDDGRELFGDATPLAGGGFAHDGIAALADLDTNADGEINIDDAVFADLRVWQDLNQDGLSQEEELLSLDTLGIVSINLTRIRNLETRPDGNQIADKATFERADGTEGGVGTNSVVDVNLAVDAFRRKFTDSLPLPSAIQASRTGSDHGNALIQ